MSRLIQLIAACAVIYTFLFAKCQANAESSHDVIDISLENSYTFANNANLYTVQSTNTSLHVNSTSTNMKPCKLAINSTIDFTSYSVGAKALTSGQRFVVWGIHEIGNLQVGEDVHDAVYTFFLVDPTSCSYKSVFIPTSKRDLEDESNEILVVTNSDSFDVFLPSLKNCSPCRFNAEGQRVELQHQLELSSPNSASFVIPRGLYIEPIRPIDRKHGYFIARNFKNNTSVMEYLDEDFKTLKQVYVDHLVQSVSVWPSKDPLLSICHTSGSYYKTASPQNLKVQCQQLDSNLQPKHSIRLDDVPMPRPPFVDGTLRLTHQINSMGNIYVGLIEASVKQNKDSYLYKPFFLRYLAYDVTGKLLKSIHTDPTGFNPITEASKSFYRGFLRSHLLSEDKFCLINNEFVSKKLEKIHEVVMCFNI